MKTSVIMKRDSHTVSPWQQPVSETRNKTQPLPDSEIFDTLIIGGGITGVTTALLLQLAGQRCCLIEKKNLGFGTTGGTTAHLNTFFDATYPEIERDFDSKIAKTIARAGKETIRMIADFIERYQIDCDFEYKNAYLFSENEKETKQLKQILKAAQKAGVEVAETDDNGVPVPFKSSILFKGQAQFHPIKYISALADEFLRLGGIILENSFVKKTEIQSGVHTAVLSDGVLKGRNLVQATHIPSGVNLLNFRCAAYRSYVLGVRLTDDNYPGELAYDMQEPYHYFRTHLINGKKYLIVGGEDHKTGHGNPQKAFENLEAYVRNYFNVDSVGYRWSAQYYVPVDGLPYIGQLPDAPAGTYTGTGFNGNGMIFGTLSAKLISDRILGHENPYLNLFDPMRMKPIAGFSAFVKENADVAWHFIADRFSAEELKSLAALKPEEGMVAAFRGRKMAIYKDAEGGLTALNPTCTHAGCTVKFNEAEKSWDCPCHGGRYDIWGKVLNGPPVKDLERIPPHKSTGKL
jgi:glycine/D-amino acid oxidase-like deaminating enzyme/nitrite reductase/ring-hydroxylating ferredoxin subunit